VALLVSHCQLLPQEAGSQVQQQHAAAGAGTTQQLPAGDRCYHLAPSGQECRVSLKIYSSSFLGFLTLLRHAAAFQCMLLPNELNAGSVTTVVQVALRGLYYCSITAMLFSQLLLLDRMMLSGTASSSHHCLSTTGENAMA